MAGMQRGKDGLRMAARDLDRRRAQHLVFSAALAARLAMPPR